MKKPQSTTFNIYANNILCRKKNIYVRNIKKNFFFSAKKIGNARTVR